MSDVTARLKHHLWTHHSVDPSAVVVTLGANGKAQSFGVDPNHSQVPGRKIPLSVEFEGGTVNQGEFDGQTGVHPVQAQIR